MGKSIDKRLKILIIEVYLGEKMTQQKETKVAKPSKKVLMAVISDKSGKSLKELESLSRSNVDTIEWIISLL